MLVVGPNLTIIDIEKIRDLLKNNHVIIREEPIKEGHNYIVLKDRYYYYEVKSPYKVFDALIYPDTFEEFLTLAKNCSCRLSTRLKRCKDYKKLIRSICIKPLKRYKYLVKINQNFPKTRDYRITLFRTHGIDNYFIWFLHDYLERSIQLCYKNLSIEDYNKPINRLLLDKTIAEHIIITAFPYL